LRAEDEVVLLLVTFPGRDDAERLGEQLVEELMAGAGLVIPAVHSFAINAGRLQREHEALLILHTTKGQSERAQARLAELHGSPNLAIVEIAASGGSQRYLDWLAGAVDAPRAEAQPTPGE